MIPGCAKLGGLEGVDLAVSWRDWAFCNAWNSVLGNGVQLAEAMPVHASTVICELVVDSDLDSIAPV